MQSPRLCVAEPGALRWQCLLQQLGLRGFELFLGEHALHSQLGQALKLDIMSEFSAPRSLVSPLPVKVEIVSMIGPPSTLPT